MDRLLRIRRRRRPGAAIPADRQRHLRRLPERPRHGPGDRTEVERHRARGKRGPHSHHSHDQHQPRAGNDAARGDHCRYQTRDLRRHEQVVVDRRCAPQFSIRLRSCLGNRPRASRPASPQSGLRRHDAGFLAVVRCGRRSRQLADLGRAELRQRRSDADDARGARRAGGAISKCGDVLKFDVIDRALEAAGGDEADANFISSDANITRFANSSIIQNMSEVSAELTLRVVIDSAIGVASTTSFEHEAIAEMAAVAREAARHSLPLRDFAGLYRGNEAVPDLPIFHGADITPGEKARALRTMFDRGREAGVHFAGSYGTDTSSVACGN
ncbi:MAG: hypothetical protein DMF59_16530, partial [Acidobacteria bacterium]